MDAGVVVPHPPSPAPHRPVLSPIPALPPPPGPLSMLTIPSTTSSILPMRVEKPVYSSPPPAPSNPENNTCRMIDYRGAKVAAFTVDGRELICLPQAFELFLKHLVGGLHTVYTKLKRLDITPIVCNVEQVRVLRGLGAIQPGVNRCKLISPKEFDVLYEDCTNSSARPGRPPKRSPVVTANPETLEKLKKSRLDNGDIGYPYNTGRLLDPKKSPLFGNGYHYPPHLAGMSVPFMPMGHPMMTMAMANHMGLRPDGSVIRDRHSHAPEDLTHRHREEPRYEDSMGHLEDNNNHKTLDKPLNLQTERVPERRPSLHDKESGIRTPNDLINGQLDLSMKGHMHSGHHDDLDDDSDDDKDLDDDLDVSDGPSLTNDDLDDSDARSLPNGDRPEKVASPPPSLPYSAQMLTTENTGISSVETLLMNIQGLLKVASENARHRERQTNYEKAELKMDLMRERELRENLEKQLIDEQRNKSALLRRLKKEKKVRRRLQEQLELPLQSQPTLHQPQRPQSNPSGDEITKLHSPTENLRMMGDSSGPELERERSQSANDIIDRRITDPHSGIQSLMDSILGPQNPCNLTNPQNSYMHPNVIKPLETA